MVELVLLIMVLTSLLLGLFLMVTSPYVGLNEEGEVLECKLLKVEFEPMISLSVVLTLSPFVSNVVEMISPKIVLLLVVSMLG